MKELNDTNFDEMSYEHLKEIALRLIPHACFEKIYYCQTGAKLSLGVRELKSTQYIADMLKVGYDNGNEIDMLNTLGKDDKHGTGSTPDKAFDMDD
ncbi:hypothetical protein Tco_0743591 [Tanacetum coccineum]